MFVRIHRGAQEIGGTCVELAHEGARILLDLGLPLDGEPDDASCHPAVDGLAGGGDLKALILSHGHRDHVGLAHLAGSDLPIVMGAATKAILTAAAPFVPDAYLPPSTITMENGKPFTFGPFTVTPILVDHSAYDAYALLVEAGGQRLFYSGDFRGHGRKASLFERLIRQRRIRKTGSLPPPRRKQAKHPKRPHHQPRAARTGSTSRRWKSKTGKSASSSTKPNISPTRNSVPAPGRRRE